MCIVCVLEVQCVQNYVNMVQCCFCSCMCTLDHGACLCMYGDMQTSVGSSMHTCLTPHATWCVCASVITSCGVYVQSLLCVQRVEQRKSTRPWLALSWYRCQFIGDGYQTIAGHSMVGHRSSRGKGSRA